MEIGCLTDVGLRKSNNEDTIGINRISVSYGTEIIDFALLIVADGVGGLEAGEKASSQAVKTISDNFASTITTLMQDFDHKLRMGDYIDWCISNLLTRSIIEANDAIYENTLLSSFNSNSATTVCAAVIQNGKAYFANVGDSRAYIINNDRIIQITSDHSLVGDLLKENKITEEEAFIHPQRNIINRAVGNKKEVEVDVFTEKVTPGGYILVCCDGLTDLVKDKEIHDIILDLQNPNKICRKLVDLANENGGKDNISVILAKTDDLDSEMIYKSTIKSMDEEVEDNNQSDSIDEEEVEENNQSDSIDEEKAKNSLATKVSNLQNTIFGNKNKNNPTDEEKVEVDNHTDSIDEKMKVCKNCGNSNPMGEIFCDNCGFDLGT